MKLPIVPRMLLVILTLVSPCLGADPDVAQLAFDTSYFQPDALQKAGLPAWVKSVEQQQGAYRDEPKCWFVSQTQAKGAGKLMIAIDRTKLNTDLVATVLFDAGDGADIAVQLVDAKGLVVSVDLFGNLVDVGKQAMTNTFVVPLEKYPTAEKIVLRRIQGDVTVYGVVLYPVMSEGTPKAGAMEALAKVLGDPLSPENPLVKGLQGVARNGHVALSPAAPTKAAIKAAAPAAATTKTERYKGAVLPPPDYKLPASAAEGLLAYWNFEEGAKDASGHANHGRPKAAMPTAEGVSGKAIVFDRNKEDAILVQRTKSFDLQEPLSFTAWIRYRTIAPGWGSQIIWFGDDRLGRDPWTLQLLRGGWLEFRSDRSVTGEAKFVVFNDELQYNPGGEALATQHVDTIAPQPLAPQTWYFVAATIEKVSARGRVMRLYVNGNFASETRTEETINYDTAPMWMTIGGVDAGGWQNYDGLMDEVRIYNRTLSPADVRSLYGSGK